MRLRVANSKRKRKEGWKNHKWLKKAREAKMDAIRSRM